jgi:hypothetical protein
LDKSRPPAPPRRTAIPSIRPLIRSKAVALSLAALAAAAALGCTLLGAARLRAAAPAPVRQETPADPAAAATPSLALTMTVGASVGKCAAENSITVPAGRRVYVCYTATNTGDVTFTNHLISDQSLDPVHAAFARPMPPGETISTTTQARVFEATTTVNDVWTANNSPNGVVQVQAEDSVVVNVVNPNMEVKTTVGAGDGGCADTATYRARQGTRAQFCVRVKNTGDTPLSALQVTVTSQPANAINVTGTITSHPLLPLAPDGVLDIFDTGAFNGQLTGSLVITSGAVTVTATSTVRATTIDGFPITPPNSTAVMSVGRADVALTASVNTAAECGTATSISPLVNQPFYYCLRVQNTGSVPLTNHVIRSATPPISVTFTYPLEPQASMAVTNDFLKGIGQPEVMGPRIYTSTATISTSFAYTASNAAGFVVTKNSSAVSAGVVVPTATLTPTPRPTDEDPTNTPWPTLTPTPSWTPLPTSTPTWTPVTPSATPTHDWAASNIATPTPNPALAAGAPIPDVNATNAAAQMTAAAAATNAAPGATSPLETPTPFFEQSPLDPFATPDTLDVALPPGTPTPHALFFMPTATSTITPTAVAAARPFAPPAAPPPAPSGASSGAGLFLANVFDATVAAAGLIWFAAGTVIFFGAAGIMAALIWRDAARGRARRRAHAYDLEAEAPFTSSLEPQAPMSVTPTVTPPAGLPPASTPPRARPPAQDDTHWPTSLP